jgi:hypothetical protein
MHVDGHVVPKGDGNPFFDLPFHLGVIGPAPETHLLGKVEGS